MKSLKRCVLVILLVICFINMATIAMAQEIDSIDSVRSDLIERGYPVELLEKLDETLLMAIYEDEGLTYASHSIENFYFLENGEVQTRAAIDSTELELVCIASVNNNGNVEIYYSYNWLILPFFRWIDTIGFSWDPELFDMVAGSFSRVDQYKTSSGVSKVHSSGENTESASSTGITWKVDLKGYGLQTPTALFGYANFELQGTASATTFYSRYFHTTLSETIVLLIPKYGPIEIPSPSTGDSRPLTTPFPG